MDVAGAQQERAASSRRSWAPWSLAAIVLVAFNLRGPLVALPSVSGQVQAGLHSTAGAVGTLTSIPVLCFGLAAPLASLLISRTQLRTAVVLSMAGVAAGTLVRSSGGYGVALTGTLLLGIAIAVGNIALPVVVGEHFGASVGIVTALFTAAFNVGSAVTSATTPLLAAAAGWRFALGAWGVLALLAAGLTWQASRRRLAAQARDAVADAAPTPARATPAPDAAPDAVRAAVWRRAGTWGLTAAFAGQAFSYYGATAWLPTLLVDERGMGLARAGASSAIFQVTAVAGAFGVPALLRATGRPRLVLWIVSACWAALPLGLVLAPQLWWLWCVGAGAAQGGGVTVVFVAVVARSAGVVERRQLSALVQGAGYTVAAAGPAVVGAVHDATGGWTAPMAVVGASIGLLLVAGSLVLPARS